MVGVDVGEVGAVPAGTTDPPAAAAVTEVEAEVEEGITVVAEAAMVVPNTVVEGGTVAEEEEDGGKSNNRCWADQISIPPRGSTILASSNKFLHSFSLSPQLSSTCLLDSVRCSHDPSLALSRCSSAHWLFFLALSLLSCPFSNLACILFTSFPHPVLSWHAPSPSVSPLLAFL